MNLISHSFLFFLVGVSLFIFSSVYADVSENDTEFNTSVILYEGGDTVAALENIRQFLIENPDHHEAKSNECAFLVELNRLLEAEDCLQKIVSEHTDDVVNLNNLANLYFLRGDYYSAKIQYAIVHNLVPDDVLTHSNLLSARVMAGDDPEEILQELYELLEKDSSVVNVFLTIAKLLNDKNQPAEARTFLEKIPITNNTSVKVFTQFGISYALERDFQNAEKYLLLGYEREPENIGVLNNLGKVYSDLGDETNNIEYYKKSIELYESVLDIEPNNEKAKKGLDYAYGKLFGILELQLALFISGVLVLGIGVIIWYYFRYQKLLQLQKLEKVTKTKKQRIKNIFFHKIVIIFLTGFMSIPLFLFAVSFGFKVQIIVGNDMSNWTSTVIEVVIGATIAVIILSFELSKQDKIDSKQDEITNLVNTSNKLIRNTKDIALEIKRLEKNQQKLIKKQQEFVKNENERIKQWKMRFGNLIHEDLSSIKQLYDALEDWIKNYQKNPTPEQKSNIIRNTKNNGDLIKFHTQNILRFLPKIESYFVDPVLGVNITNLCKHYPTLFFSMKEEYSWSSEGLEGTLLSIKEKQKFLDRDMQRIIDEGALPEE